MQKAGSSQEPRLPNVSVHPLQEGLESFGGHIVHDIEFWFEAALRQIRKLVLENFDERLVLGVHHRLGQDGVRRPIVKDEDGGHAVNGSEGEVAGEVGEDGAILGVQVAQAYE